MVHALKGEVRVFPYGEIDWIEGESLLSGAGGDETRFGFFFFKGILNPPSQRGRARDF